MIPHLLDLRGNGCGLVLVGVLFGTGRINQAGWRATNIAGETIWRGVVPVVKTFRKPTDFARCVERLWALTRW